MAHHQELEWEPIPGLPAELPKGERIVWQGSPNWWALAISTFHVRKVALYFAFLVGMQIVKAWKIGFDQEAVMAGPALTLLLSLAALSILLSLAWLSATSTIFTLTSERILIRYGIALTLTLNLPFKRITAANLKLWKAQQAISHWTLPRPKDSAGWCYGPMHERGKYPILSQFSKPCRRLPRLPHKLPA